MLCNRSAPSNASGRNLSTRGRIQRSNKKVKLLDMLWEEEKSCAAIARHYGLNELTIRYIKKDEAYTQNAKRTATAHNNYIAGMELALAPWITDCRKKNIWLDTNIRDKASQLY